MKLKYRPIIGKRRRFYNNLRFYIKEILFCVTTLITISVVFGLLFPNEFIIKLLKLEKNVLNDFIQSLCDFNWLQFCVFFLLILAIIFSVRNLRISIKEVNKQQWVKCNGFPNKDRLCSVVENYLSNHQSYKYYGSALCYKIDKDNKMWSYFTVISQFVLFSKQSMKMTLVDDPYHQINDSTQWDMLKGIISNLENRMKKTPIEEKEKIISLTDAQYNTFIQHFCNELRNLERKPITDFEDYLTLHKKIDLKLHWHRCTTKSIEDFIIIDDTVLLTMPSDIELHFSHDRIETESRKFDSIKSLRTTKNFIDEYIMPSVRDRLSTDKNWNNIEKYLTKLK